MNEIKPGRRVVGRDGPPTPETAPWGVRYWPWHGGTNGDIGFVWHTPTPYTNAGNWMPDTEWEPLPEPSSEYVSAPERWSHDRGFIKCSGSPINEAEVNAAVDALNTLDRDGVVYGPGRPMEELRGRYSDNRDVLVRCGDVWLIRTTQHALSNAVYFDCWLPLPVPEDTNAG